MLIALLFLLVVLSVIVEAYNRPDCPSWPADDVWRSELGQRISAKAELVKVFHEGSSTRFYENTCFPCGTDPYALANESICLQAPVCAFQFCDETTGESNLPSYVLAAKTSADVTAGLEFAQRYDIPVSVKLSGHSFSGSSTARHSLMIWMLHFEKDDEIRNVTDSCGSTYTTVGIGGGELWNDVLEAVQDRYHIVTGGCRTVGAVGGWLQGHGLSFTSRKYGLGIDQVVRMNVVLPNGTEAVVDRCQNPDLFWALRGGGGGTFSVVTHVDYKVHPVMPITVMTFRFDPTYLIDMGRFDLVEMWLEFWVTNSLTLGERWSGHFNGAGAHLTFVGTVQDALDNFGSSFHHWYRKTFMPSARETNNMTLPREPEIRQTSSWYHYKGGGEDYLDPIKTVQTGGDFEEGYGSDVGARLVPLEMVQSDPQKVVSFLADFTQKGYLAKGANYFLGGNINSVPVEDASVHPAMRRAIYHIVITGSKEVHDELRDFLPNSVTGVSFNHQSADEPNWRDALWGDNYERLLELKDEYDPNRRLNCWHCVGYVGPDPEDPSFRTPPCPV